MARRPRTFSDKVRDATRNAKASLRDAIDAFRRTIETTLDRDDQRNIYRRHHKEFSARIRKGNKSLPKNRREYETSKDKVVRIRTPGPAQLGKMCFFFYDAEHKDKLEYWDRMPLIIPFNVGLPDHFLGINLHYIPPALRANLLDDLMDDPNTNIKQAYRLEKQKKQRGAVGFNYQVLERAAKSNYYKPCVKMYLRKNVIGRITVVPEEDIPMLLFLPWENFESKGKSIATKTVHTRSTYKARRS
jgi:hypothetical protein